MVIPSLAYVLLLAAAVVLTLVYPIRFLPQGALRLWIGLLLVAAGTAALLWALVTMGRHHTDGNPDRAPSTLVVEGPFRYSRNPFYLGFVAFFVGMAVAVNSVWLLAYAGTELVLADLQTRREEAYLETFFGHAYLDYRSRVRRWL